tara:strand:- start:36 stop:884 length:849 start_codon:yes stop_codon:yes gene_type:complete
MWSRRKAGLYVQDALADFYPDVKALPSPIAQRKIYRNRLMATHLVGFGGGTSAVSTLKSYSFDGTGDFLDVNDSTNWFFNAARFTADFWIRMNSIALDFQWMGQGTDSSNLWFLRWDAVDGAEVQHTDESVYSKWNQGATTGWSADVWYHVALIRGWGGNVDDWAITRDGVAVATTTSAAAIGNLTSALKVGAHPTGGGATANARMDEIRISKGTAEWTADFSGSLPTEEYANSTYELTIHCNETIVSGTTGSGATFVDSGSTGHTVTEVGNAIRDTSIYKF